MLACTWEGLVQDAQYCSSMQCLIPVTLIGVWDCTPSLQNRLPPFHLSFCITEGQAQKTHTQSKIDMHSKDFTILQMYVLYSSFRSLLCNHNAYDREVTKKHIPAAAEISLLFIS